MRKSPESVAYAPKQFSATSDPAMMQRNYLEVKNVADRLASQIGGLDDITGGATHYVTKGLYAKQVNNRGSWISRMGVTKVIGNHVFMRERASNVRDQR